jgi:hypothetical protein
MAEAPPRFCAIYCCRYILSVEPLHLPVSMSGVCSDVQAWVLIICCPIRDVHCYHRAHDLRSAAVPQTYYLLPHKFLGFHPRSASLHRSTLRSRTSIFPDLILQSATGFLLRQRLNHLRNRERLCTVRFLVCRIRKRVEATEEPEFLKVAD